MPVHHDEDFPAALAILLAGMLAPALVAAIARDFMSMYVTAREFVLVFAVGYGIVAWGLIERLDLDRTSFLLVSIVGPWPVLLASLFGVLLLNEGEQIATGPVADVFRYLTGSSVASFFGYGALFTLAGAGAVALSKQFDELAARRGRIPDARVVFAGIGLAVVLVVLLAGGANHVAASSASISSVEPGVQPYQDPSINVTVAGRPAELRVTAIGPDGTSVTKRLSRGDMRAGTETVAFRVRLDDKLPPDVLPVESGTYRVKVTTLAGVSVDTAEYHLERAPTPSLSNVIVSSDGIDRDELPQHTVELAPTRPTSVGIEVGNPSEFPAAVTVSIHAPDTYAHSFDILVRPGERAGVVFSIPDDAVAAIHDEHGGVVTVELTQDGRTVAARSVELPSE